MIRLQCNYNKHWIDLLSYPDDMFICMKAQALDMADKRQIPYQIMDARTKQILFTAKPKKYQNIATVIYSGTPK